MKQRFHSMSLKMLYLSLVLKYTKCISRNLSKSTFFTYILVPGLKFVYRHCMWRSFTATSLFDNLHSMFYQHIKSHRTRDLSHIFSMPARTRAPWLGWTRPVFVEAVIQCADVHRSSGLSPDRSLLVPFLSRQFQHVTQKGKWRISVWNFLPTKWRKKDVTVQNG